MKCFSVSQFKTKLAVYIRKISINVSTGLHTNRYHISFSILLNLNFVQHNARQSGQAICFQNPFTTQSQHTSRGQKKLFQSFMLYSDFFPSEPNYQGAIQPNGCGGFAVCEQRTTYLSCMETSYSYERKYFSHHALIRKGQKYVFLSIIFSVMTKAVSSLRANVVQSYLRFMLSLKK